MADKGIPLRFTIGNQGNIASNPPTGYGCTKITFGPPGIAPLTTWSAVPLTGGFYAFQQSSTGYFATAVNGQVLACPGFSQEGQSTFWVVRNADGTYLVALNTSKAIWTVKPDGSLGFGPAITGPQNSFTLTQA